MRVVVVAAVLAGGLLVAGCGGAAGTSPPDTPPDVTGTVTEWTPFTLVTDDCVTPPSDPDAPVTSDDPPFCTDPDDDTLGTVLVEEDPSQEVGDTKISFRITADTTILREVDGGHEPAGFDDLARGAVVSAWSTGPIAESYPMQATAAAIVVHPSP
ncbi:MAG TPA: hypothetical protein VIK95_13350 [Egibacteraceae bacterium]